jgi:hypothetical protein
MKRPEDAGHRHHAGWFVLAAGAIRGLAGRPFAKVRRGPSGLRSEKIRDAREASQHCEKIMFVPATMLLPVSYPLLQPRRDLKECYAS